MPVKHLRNVLNALPCLFLVQINQQRQSGFMIILSKRVGQVSSNQPLGDENYGPQDSRLIFVSKNLRRIANSMSKDKR